MKKILPIPKITKLYSNWDDEDIRKIEIRKRLKTNITELDKLIKFPSGFYIISSNPGVGKSWFALWLSKTFYKLHNKKSIYFNLEMDETLVRARIHQSWSGLNQMQYEAGMNIDKALDLMKKDIIVVDNFFAEDTKLRTPQNFYEYLIYYYSKGYRCFHFDHLHELDGMNDNNKNQQLNEEWSAIFKKLNDELDDIWLFIYAQPNGMAGSKPILRRTDIAGSKAITQRCEFFISLNKRIKKDYEDANEEDRNIYVFLDKGRTETKTHCGCWIRLDETGNFVDYKIDAVMQAFL